jgi:hypothetical protein
VSANTGIIDRIADRLKSDGVGSLIAEEDLYDLVKQALDRAFFAETRCSGKPESPTLVSMVRELVREEVSRHVNAWFEENKKVVLASWKKVFDEGLTQYVDKLQSEKATAHIRHALQPMLADLNNERASRGLPMIYF